MGGEAGNHFNLMVGIFVLVLGFVFKKNKTKKQKNPFNP